VCVCVIPGYSDGAGVHGGQGHPHDDEAPAVLLEDWRDHRGPDEPGQSSTAKQGQVFRLHGGIQSLLFSF